MTSKSKGSIKYSVIFLFVLIFGLVACKDDKAQESNSGNNGENAALEELNELIRNQKGDDGLLFERAKLYYGKKAYDEAIDDLVLAQKIDSIKPDYYHLLADVYMDYYKSFEALKTMQKVVFLHPQRIPSLLKLAEFQYILKQYEASVITLNNVLAVDRLEPEAFFMLGMNFRAIGDIERAKNSFQTAVENNPDLVDAWMMLGSIYEGQNDPQALVYYDNALLVSPDNIDVMHAKAFYFQNHKDIQAAIDLYKKINVLDPSYSDAYLNTGLLYLEMDSLAKAHEHFNIMIKSDVTNPIGYFYRAYTFEQIGELKKARMDYEQAIKLAPDFEEAKNALELLTSRKPS